MLPDNSTVSKWVAADNVKSVLAAVVLQELVGPKGRMLQAIDEGAERIGEWVAVGWS